MGKVKKCKDCGHSKCKCSSKQEQKVEQNVEVKVNVTDNDKKGNQGPQGGGASTIYLASDDTLPNNQFFGLGVDDPDPTRTNVVIAQTSTITGFVFSIRDEPLTAAQSITGTIFRSTDCGVTFVNTGISVTITGPNPGNCCGSTTASLVVNQCDLLTVQVTRVGSAAALEEGAAATILLSTP
ncbi:hypothetical protein ABIE66_006043 [Peribacillus sp. B2I2]|uniref:hypothetical protein n=1 Tax=Peribacillus sp. B2I2 TaxID=3156468 RepID=UPI0035159383